MKIVIPKGSTSRILHVFIQASNVTTGAGLGSLTEASSIVGGYVREGGTGVALAVDEDVTTEGTYQAPSAVGKVRIGTPANMRTGTYELHFHNDLWATGAESVAITLGGASNMADLTIEVQLSDPVRGLGSPSALPNAAAGASTGLLINGSNSGTITFAALTITGTTTYTGHVLYSDGIAIAAPSTANREGFIVTGNGTGDGVKVIAGGGAGSHAAEYVQATAAEDIISFNGEDDVSAINTSGNYTGSVMMLGTTAVSQVNAEVDTGISDAALATAAALTTAQNDLNIITGADGAIIASGTQTFNMTGSITGNLSGSVGSVTGAVGSVTGAVGSVTGSVGSVLGGLNTSAGTITTLDGLDTAQDTQHGTTQTYLANNLGAAGVAATEAGGTGDQLTGIPWNAAWDTEVQSEVTDALNAALTEAYRTTGATGSVAQLLYEIIAHLGEFTIVSTTKTTKKLDGSTTAKTYTLDDDTTPTSITETT